MRKLSIDDVVVVPVLGVGRVDRREKLDIGGQMIDVYHIDLEDEGTYWVPVDRVDSEGVREPLPANRVDEIWDAIESTTAPKKRATWNRRQRRYQEMVMSNEPLEIAKLLGELASVRQQKKAKKQVLSFQERRMFERAKTLIVQEVAASTGRDRDAIATNLEKIIEAAA